MQPTKGELLEHLPLVTMGHHVTAPHFLHMVILSKLGDDIPNIYPIIYTQ